MNLNQLSKWLYRAARTTRDAQAISQGPKATIKRSVSKPVYRAGNKAIAKSLRSLFKGF